MDKIHQASYKNVNPNVKTSYIDPFVKKIDSMNQMIEVWRFTRPYLTLKDAKKETRALEDIDLPMNGMKSYIFELRTSILFRDLIYSMRPIASAWARSHRTIPFNQENMFFSSEYKTISKKNQDELQKEMKNVYQKLYDGVDQDDARAEMPMAVSTEYTINIDDRTLVAFLKILKIHNKSLYNVYSPLFLEAIGKTDSYVTSRNLVDVYNKYYISPSEKEAVKDGSYNETLLETTAGFYKIQTRLAAQFIRQHYSTIKNELFNIIDLHESLDDLSHYKENSIITVGVYANKNSFNKMLKNRSAWFAQWDHEDTSSWSLVLKPYVQKMSPVEFMKFTRSQNGRSVYFHDLWANITGQAVMPPDPFLLEMPEIIDIRESMMKSDSTVFLKWKEMRDAGLINDNPDNPFRKVYQNYLDTGQPQLGEIEPDPSPYDHVDDYD